MARTEGGAGRRAPYRVRSWQAGDAIAGPAGGGGIVAPSFSITGTWEPEQQIVAISQFNMVFDGVQVIGDNGSYLQIFDYTESISD